MAEPRTKESGEDRVERDTALQRHGVEPPTRERLLLNRDFQDGYAAGIEATKAERDALREALEEIDTLCQVSGLDTLVGRAARKGLAALDRRP